MGQNTARHRSRAGRPAAWVPRRRFDTVQRAAAASLDAAERAWSVQYSVELRRFVAFPCWPGAPAGLVVREVTSEGLVAAMRGAELAGMWPGRGWPR